MSNPMTIRIYVASPENLKEEIALLNKAVYELNSMWNKEDIKLKVFKWGVNSIPRIGSKNLTNGQINYDIFIGIIWKTLRPLTKNRSLGLESEFYRAIDQFILDSESIKLTFYFNNVIPRLDDMENVSSTSIRNFKAKLKNNKVPYYEYIGVEDFYPLIKTYLTQQIKELKKKSKIEDKNIINYSNENYINKNLSKIVEGTEEDGFLDFSEEWQEDLERFSLAIKNIGSATKNLTDNMNKRGDELQVLSSDFEQKNVLKKIANDMNEFVNNVEPEISIFSESYLNTINSLTKSTIHAKDNDQILDAISSAQDIKSLFIELEDNIKVYKDVFSSLPSITNDIDMAKKNMLSTLNILIDEVIEAKKLTLNAENKLKNAI